jgi:hypothetical protein
LRILRELAIYVWPKDRPDVRARVVLAVSLLLASKAANVSVPYLFKLAVDGMSSGAAEVSVLGAVALAPSALLASYGLARGGAALCNGARCCHNLRRALLTPAACAPQSSATPCSPR